MKTKKTVTHGLFVAAILISSGYAYAREVGTAQGQSGDRVYACKVAKDDAERQARNNRSVVTGYQQCQCSEQKAYSQWYRTVDFSMEKEKK